MKTRAEVAEEWFDLAVAAPPWVRSRNQAGAMEGACHGLMVTWPELGRRAYMKPTVVLAHCGPPREKLGSDLARLVGVRVPPAVLMERQDDGEHPKSVVLSLVLHDVPASWRQMKRYFEYDSDLSDESNEWWLSEGRRATAAFVFDTWVGQHDHDDHPHNIVVGSNSETRENELVFLDYERAFGADGSWQDEAGNVAQAGFPPVLKELFDTKLLEETVSKVEGLEDKEIERLVRRIPVAHLSKVEQEMIVRGLCVRKPLLREALAGVQ